MSEWHYHNPVEIHFGPGVIDNLPDFVSGKTVLATSLGTTMRGIPRKISKLLGTSLVTMNSFQNQQLFQVWPTII